MAGAQDDTEAAPPARGPSRDVPPTRPRRHAPGAGRTGRRPGRLARRGGDPPAGRVRSARDRPDGPGTAAEGTGGASAVRRSLAGGRGLGCPTRTALPVLPGITVVSERRV